MSSSKTAQKSTVKAPAGKFVPHGDMPRFIPMQNGEIIFRNPVTGRNERSTLPQLVDKLEEEFAEHPLYGNMVHDLADIGATRLLNHLEEATELVQTLKQAA